MKYFQKMRGTTEAPPGIGLSEIAWSWIGAMLGIASVAYLNYNVLGEPDSVMIIGSFGASAVLLYGAIRSPLAQPRNLVGGHVLSAFIGVVAYQLLGGTMWLSASVAVATAIAVMHGTRTLHPPGGATALIAVVGSQKIHDLGFLYPFVPVAMGALTMLVVALLVNNLSGRRRYPEFWF